jgi:hypothetical protein
LSSRKSVGKEHENSGHGDARAGLATVMVVMGFTIASVMTRFDTVVLGQKDVAPFLSIPFGT